MSLRNVQAIPDLPFNVNPFIDITDQLPIRPDPNAPRTPEQITHISVHHSAVEGGTIQGYADYHVKTLGWAHIGYHMVIKGDQVYQTNDLLTFSYHTASNNSYTVSVSVSGDLSKRPLSEVERNALYAVILTYMDVFGIPVENVWGHNEFPQNATSCPCIDMVKVREDIRAIQLLMQRKKSRPTQLEKAYAVANQVTYLYGLAKQRDGDGEWALGQLVQVEDIMKSKGLL